MGLQSMCYFYKVKSLGSEPRLRGTGISSPGTFVLGEFSHNICINSTPKASVSLRALSKRFMRPYASISRLGRSTDQNNGALQTEMVPETGDQKPCNTQEMPVTANTMPWLQW